jgi:hypothetical protein
MADTYIVIEVEDSILKVAPLAGKKLRFIVTPHLQIIPEERSVDAIIKAADDQGFECRYASSAESCTAPWIWNKIENNVLAHLRKTLRMNVRRFDVSIDPLAILKKH